MLLLITCVLIGMLGFSLSVLGSEITIVDTVHDLRLLEPKPNMKVIVNGYWSANDGGGGTFVWDLARSGLDDKGMVISSNVDDSGAWLRRIDEGGPIDIRWYGAISNTEACQAYAIDAAMRWFWNTNTQGIVIIPAGIYNVKKSVWLYSGVSLIGEGNDLSFINYVDSDEVGAILNCGYFTSNSANLTLKDFAVNVGVLNKSQWFQPVWLLDVYDDFRIDNVTVITAEGDFYSGLSLLQEVLDNL